MSCSKAETAIGGATPFHVFKNFNQKGLCLFIKRYLCNTVNCKGSFIQLQSEGCLLCPVYRCGVYSSARVFRRYWWSEQ